MDKSYSKRMKVLEAFREIDPEMPMQMAVVFLNVAADEGLNMTELYKRSGISQASCSRNVAALSKWHRLKKAGHNLVFTQEDPMERRRKVVFLTERGQELAEKIKNIR